MTKKRIGRFLKKNNPRTYFFLREIFGSPKYIWELRALKKKSVIKCDLFVFIIGSSRSGTSFTAMSLKKAGLSMPGPFIPPDSFNIEGYWENEVVVHINQEILEASDGHWFFPPSIIRCYKHQRLRIRKELLKMEGEGRVVGWKDPRATLTLDFWMREADRNNIPFKVIGVYRDPESMANSVLKHEEGKRKISRHEIIEAWIVQNRNLINWSDKLGDAFLWVCFDQPSDSLQRNLRFVASRIGLDKNKITSDLFKPNLRHYREKHIDNKKALEIYNEINKRFSKQNESV